MNKEQEIQNTKNRIALLESRQPLRENQKIVKKLTRKIRRLENMG